MHVKPLDLNLLQLFAAIYRTGSVTRAAEQLGVAQPAASHGLARLRKELGDALFVRTGGGVQPTPFAERLAPKVESALGTLNQAMLECRSFQPATADRTFRLHMSDIGESTLLPVLMAILRLEAPGIRLETQYLPQEEIADALHAGRVNFAIGVLPLLQSMPSHPIATDRYRVVVSRLHPLAGLKGTHNDVKQVLEALNFVAVSTHSDTTRLLRLLGLESRLRLTIQHFTALPAVVRDSDLAAIMPMAIAALFPADQFAVLDVPLPTEPFEISIFWSHRWANDAAGQWFKALVVRSMARIHKKAAPSL